MLGQFRNAVGVQNSLFNIDLGGKGGKWQAAYYREVVSEMFFERVHFLDVFFLSTACSDCLETQLECRRDFYPL